MRFLRRYHLFEFCDQSWLPVRIRRGFHRALSGAEELFKIYEETASIIADCAKALSVDCILDVCSGTGRAIEMLIINAKRKAIILPKFYVSDLYPSLEDFKALQNNYPNQIDFIEHRLDLEKSDIDDYRLVTIFSALHHFKPDKASLILNNLLEKGVSIIIFENFVREYKFIFLYLLGAPFIIVANAIALLRSQAIPKYALFDILLTIIVPIFPIMLYFDGLVSILRTYRADEVKKMLKPELLENYKFEAGQMLTSSPLPSQFITIIKNS
jgi:SAM-dependent methyltransferase